MIYVKSDDEGKFLAFKCDVCRQQVSELPLPLAAELVMKRIDEVEASHPAVCGGSRLK